MILQRTGSKAAAVAPSRLLKMTLIPALAFASSRAARFHSSSQEQASAAGASLPDNTDAPLPQDAVQTKASQENISHASFETQKRRLLTSMDMLYQIQDAPTEKIDATLLDDQEAQYWSRRMNSAMEDLQQERTLLRVAIVGESSGQQSVMDLLMPSEENRRRSAKETGKVHRVRYGSEYKLLEDGQENLEKAPISWLEGLSDNDGGEIVEVPGKHVFAYRCQCPGEDMATCHSRRCLLLT